MSKAAWNPFKCPGCGVVITHFQASNGMSCLACEADYDRDCMIVATGLVRDVIHATLGRLVWVLTQKPVSEDHPAMTSLIEAIDADDEVYCKDCGEYYTVGDLDFDKHGISVCPHCFSKNHVITSYGEGLGDEKPEPGIMTGSMEAPQWKELFVKNKKLPKAFGHVKVQPTAQSQGGGYALLPIHAYQDKVKGLLWECWDCHTKTTGSMLEKHFMYDQFICPACHSNKFQPLASPAKPKKTLSHWKCHVCDHSWDVPEGLQEPACPKCHSSSDHHQKITKITMGQAVQALLAKANHKNVGSWHCYTCNDNYTTVAIVGGDLVLCPGCMNKQIICSDPTKASYPTAPIKYSEPHKIHSVGLTSIDGMHHAQAEPGTTIKFVLGSFGAYCKKCSFPQPIQIKIGDGLPICSNCFGMAELDTATKPYVCYMCLDVGLQPGDSYIYGKQLCKACSYVYEHGPLNTKTMMHNTVKTNLKAKASEPKDQSL